MSPPETTPERPRPPGKRNRHLRSRYNLSPIAGPGETPLTPTRLWTGGLKPRSPNSPNSPNGAVTPVWPYPTGPEDTNDWVSRKSAAVHTTSAGGIRSVPSPIVYELPASSPSESFETSEDEAALARAIEVSFQGTSDFQGLRRTPTGTNIDELEAVLARSMIEK